MAETGENLPEPAGDCKGQRAQAVTAAAVALAGGATVKAAAAKAGIGERTLYSWLRKKPGLKRQISELRTQMASAACGRLAKAMTGAADGLTRLLRSKDEKVRLAAATRILELATEMQAVADLDRRLTEIEARNGIGRGGGAT